MYETGKGQFPDQQVCRLLVVSDFTQGDGTRTISSALNSAYNS